MFTIHFNYIFIQNVHKWVSKKIIASLHLIFCQAVLSKANSVVITNMTALPTTADMPVLEQKKNIAKLFPTPIPIVCICFFMMHVSSSCTDGWLWSLARLAKSYRHKAVNMLVIFKSVYIDCARVHSTQYVLLITVCFAILFNQLYLHILKKKHNVACAINRYILLFFLKLFCFSQIW